VECRGCSSNGFWVSGFAFRVLRFGFRVSRFGFRVLRLPYMLMNYLALGDSYTIGEGVLLQQSFPYQVVQLLRRGGYECNAPEIIANTGWTTDELQTALSATKLLPRYDFVSLLIGVNNQYRGRTSEEYHSQFESLLKKSVRLTGNQFSHVFVLSIPNWGLTPFANKLDQKKITEEINRFNQINRSIADQQHVQYIDVTSDVEGIAENSDLIIADGLHPSAKEYRRWAELIVEKLKKLI
jgi:lysophospholipase L1-like esterase